ncbi:MAG: energy-coupling factor transporter ATPase [Nitrososphaerota archaeon]
MSIINIENFYWKYLGSKDYALKNINLKIEKGEFIGIMGPTGAGKSTLCLAIAGLIPWVLPGEIKGNIIIDGMNTRNYSIKYITEKVGIVFQDPEIQFIMMSVEDEVAIGLEKMNLPRVEMIKRVDWALDVVGMKEYKDVSPEELSGGQKQRVAIATMLAKQPEILVLDEPTSDLDPKGKMEVFSVISNLRKEFDTTIIMATHESEKILKFADRIIVLNKGSKIFEDSPEKIFSRIDELKNIGIRPPQIIEVCNKLGCGTVLAIEEAKEILNKKFNLENRKYYQKIDFLKINDRKPVIEVQNVSYIYPNGFKALENINLTIYEKDYIAIIGQNGSGKTTLAKHFNGILKPTNGKVLVYGMDTKKTSISEIAKKVGYCFQNPDHQIFSNTVEEEIMFGLKQIGLSKKEIEKKVSEILKIVGLEEYRYEDPSFLGKGQRQRLAVASILALEPKILVVDEPTTGQDYAMIKDLMNLLTHLNNIGNTIIIITHDMEIAAEYAKRIIIMRNGRIVADDSPSRIFSNLELLSENDLEAPSITQLSIKLGFIALKNEDFIKIIRGEK